MENAFIFLLIFLGLTIMALVSVILFKSRKKDKLRSFPFSREEKEAEALVRIDQLAVDEELKHQPDLVMIQENWEPLNVVEKVGVFEMYSPTADTIKWRLKDINDIILLTSTADYISSATCKNGIKSAIKSIKLSHQVNSKEIKKEFNPILIGVSDKEEYSYVLKAGNGKLIGEGPLYSSEDEVEEAVFAIINLVK